jgi:sugar lactone lactonase YvrE
MIDVLCVSSAACQLGEGPCWSANDGRLYWFDIKGRQLHWLEPATGRRGAWPMPLRASAAAAREGGGLIAATEGGLMAIDGRTGAVEVLHPLKLGAGFRSNDGKIDPKGRFWWSVMDDHHGERPGSIYRSEPGKGATKVLDGVHIANTLAVSPDGGTFYLADSRKQIMWAYRLTAAGQLVEPRIFVDLRGQQGTPDGGAVDAEGFLWNAQWGAWRIVRYAPDGSVDRVVEMPVAQPTSCAFGGPDLTTLYVTSAWDGLDTAALAAQPLAGGLFALEPGVPGLALPHFTG